MIFATSSLSGLARFAFFCEASLRRVVALAVDCRDLGAHGTQVHGKLSSMVDGVSERELYEGNGGPLEHAAEVNHLYELLPAKRLESFKIRCKGLIKPGGDARGVPDRLRPRHRSEVEDAL